MTPELVDRGQPVPGGGVGGPQHVEDGGGSPVSPHSQLPAPAALSLQLGQAEPQCELVRIHLDY